MTVFRRYVAIGDSSTEGLVDPDGQGGYRGWADRLAQLIADGQTEPLLYANLAIRGLRLSEIRRTQFEAALALRPDLMTIFGGVNDVISWACDFASLQRDLEAMFGAAREQEATVVTFTMPDASRVNPLASRFADKALRLNELIRTEADRFGVLVLDFSQYPVAEDPRLWFEDRLHANELGHERLAAALAWRLGIAGADLSWSHPIAEEPVPVKPAERIRADLDWAYRHLRPWIGKGLRGIPHGQGIVAKRPVLTVVPRTAFGRRAEGA